MNEFSKFHFKGVSEDEEIVRVLHRNWFYVLTQFLLLFVLTAVFFSVIVLVPSLLPGFLASQSREFLLFFENFFILAVWIFGFLLWIDFYFDVWIITNKRIVNIEQKGMFSRKVSEMEYSKMQDVTAQVVGFFPTVLNYGDVRVQTAGEQEEFVLKTISDPYQIKNIIFNMQKKESEHNTEELGEMIKEKIS